MRMSKSGASAADIVMQSDASDLAQILWEYGEEKASRRIARAIVTARETTPITSTTQLANMIISYRLPLQLNPRHPARNFGISCLFCHIRLTQCDVLK